MPGPRRLRARRAGCEHRPRAGAPEARRAPDTVEKQTCCPISWTREGSDLPPRPQPPNLSTAGSESTKFRDFNALENPAEMCREARSEAPRGGRARLAPTCPPVGGEEARIRVFPGSRDSPWPLTAGPELCVLLMNYAGGAWLSSGLFEDHPRGHSPILWKPRTRSGLFCLSQIDITRLWGLAELLILFSR